MWYIIDTQTRTGGDNTETVLYADVLFIIDFSMDTVSLWLTGKLMHSKMKTFRVALGAVFGAAMSTLLTVLGPPIYVSMIFGVISSAVMCLITFGKESISVFVKHFAALWVVGMLLGGLMTFLMSGNSPNTPQSNHSKNVASPVTFIPIAFLLCALLLYFFCRVTSKKKTTVAVKLFERSASLEGIVDSGNLLRDPISGSPVIVVSSAASLKFLTMEESLVIRKGEFEGKYERLLTRYRVVPAKGVSGQITLNCIRPDSVSICGKSCSAVLAISDDSSFGESIECIVPAVLL